MMRSNEFAERDESRGVADDRVRVGAEAQRVLALGGGQFEHGGVRAEGSRDLHADMAQAPEAHDGHALARSGLPVSQRGI